MWFDKTALPTGFLRSEGNLGRLQLCSMDTNRPVRWNSKRASRSGLKHRNKPAPCRSSGEVQCSWHWRKECTSRLLLPYRCSQVIRRARSVSGERMSLFVFFLSIFQFIPLVQTLQTLARFAANDSTSLETCVCLFFLGSACLSAEYTSEVVFFITSSYISSSRSVRLCETLA